MRDFAPDYIGFEQAPSKEPRYVVQVSWDEADTDYTYLASGGIGNAAVPAGADTIYKTVLNISGQTQRINPDIATSTIGTVSMDMLDNSKTSNLLKYSEAIGQVPEYGATCTVTLNDAAAPDGTITASKLEDTAATTQTINQSITGFDYDAQTLIIGVWLKPGTTPGTLLQWSIFGGTTVTVNNVIDWTASPPTTSSGQLVDVGGGWYKLTDFIDNNASGNTFFQMAIAPAFSPADTGYIHAWGLFLAPINQYAGYIKTTTDPLISVNRAVGELTQRMNEKLVAGDGLRGKIIRVYVGYDNMDFDSYDLRLTYIIDGISYRDGVYTFRCSDVQRSQKIKIFTPDETTLHETINETTLIIPVTTIDTTLFPAVTHGSEWAVRAGETVAYIKIEEEVICHTGSLSFDVTYGWHISALERGALNTRAATHEVSADTDDNRKPKIEEHIYIEGAGPKVVYALLTGQLLNGASPEDTLPDHWHLGISTSFVRLADFQNIGVDLWDPATDAGKKVRIENPGTQDAKRYIEKQMLLWMGCFMPIYTTGELGLKRLVGILSDAPYDIELDKFSIVSYSDMTHDMRSVINDILVQWNYVDRTEVYTKRSLFIDADSIAIHGVADNKSFKFNTVHTGLHTDEDLLHYFDVLRDRYSGPPLLLSLRMLPSMSRLEVGDTARIKLPQIRDFTTGAGLDRTFEIQQVSTNWMSGQIDLKLFASTQAAGAITRTTLSSVLLDTFYTQAGTNLATVLTIVAGVVTVNGSLTGHATNIDDPTAIYYYDGDLEIGSGVTLSISENVQLRIKGHFTVNGDIDGTGTGATGAAATTLFENGTTTGTRNLMWGTWSAPSPIDYDYGEQGYFGIPVPALGWFSLSNVGTVPPNPDSTATAQRFDDVDTTIIKSALPFYQLSNDQQSNTLVGYPADLRGNAGAGGTPYIHNYRTSTTTQARQLLATGGAGGNGGAGLLIVHRGMSFGPDGFIDLSGGDSVVGGSYTQTTGAKFYGSAGAPGAPGALVMLSDGDHTNPDITFDQFPIEYGDQPVPVGVTAVDQQWINDNFQYGPSIAAISAHGDTVRVDGVTENLSRADLFASAHRWQYIPPDETPQLDADVAPPPTLHEKYLTQTAKVFPSSPAASDRFGSSLGISNDKNYLAMGSQYPNAGDGEIQILIRNEGVYGLQHTIVPTANLKTFGWSLLMDDSATNLIFPAQWFSGLPNPALIWYTRSGNVWTFNSQLILTNSHLGLTVYNNLLKGSADNQWCIFGGPLVNTAFSNDGQATILYRDDTASPPAYIEHSFLNPPTPGANIYFSSSVAISGDGQTCAGIELNDFNGDGTAGAWHLFTLDDTASPPAWNLDATINWAGTTGVTFGNRALYRAVLDEAGTTFIYCEPENRKLYIYEKHDGVWAQVNEFDAPDTNGTPVSTKAHLGTSMDISADGRTLSVVSLDSVDDGGVEGGSIEIYRKAEDIWVHDQTIFPGDNDNVNDGDFGTQKVAMNNNATMIVADRYLDDNSGANNGGACYCFESLLLK